MPRRLWDDSAGFATLSRYALAEVRAELEAGMLAGLAGSYLALAAAGALLRHLEQPDSSMLLAAGSLAVRQLGSSTHMEIDAATAAALELVTPNRVNGGAAANKSSAGGSLFRREA